LQIFRTYFIDANEYIEVGFLDVFLFYLASTWLTDGTNV